MTLQYLEALKVSERVDSEPLRGRISLPADLEVVESLVHRDFSSQAGLWSLR